MKVSLLITGLRQGGAETQLIRLAQGLPAHGWSVKVMSLLDDGDFRSELQGSGIPIWCARAPGLMSAPFVVCSAAAELRRDAPSILVCFLFHADVVGRIAGWRAGVPVVISSVRSCEMGGWWRESTLRVTRSLVAATTANSRVTLEHLRSRRIDRPEKLVHVPNAIDLTRFRGGRTNRAALRKDLRVDEREFLWLAVGRLDVPKDYPTLLTALDAVRNRHAVKLLIAGDGPLRGRLETELARRRLEGACRLLGHRKDVPELLAAADGFVQASAWEGLPNAVMEALAAGLPVVATDAGGTHELIIDRKTGLLVPPRDPRALAGAMMQIVQMLPEDRRAMGAAGQLSLEATYSVDSVVRRWDALFRGLLQSHRV